jgi:SAM-dependent methyltransferase
MNDIPPKKLNLGCGTDIRRGWVNLDKVSLPGVDIAHDLESLPLPFPDESFEHVFAKDVLEHVNYVDLIRDIHRILRPGGILEVQVPHFTSTDNYVDPTHIKRFSIRTFDFFVKDQQALRSYYFDFHYSYVASRKLRFYRGPLLWDYIVEPLVNLHFKIQKYYELTFVSRLFPAQNIQLTLVK